MEDYAAVSVRIPARSKPLLEQAAERYGVTPHRLMQAMICMAARDPDDLIRQALSESPNKRELNAIKRRSGRQH